MRRERRASANRGMGICYAWHSSSNKSALTFFRFVLGKALGSDALSTGVDHGDGVEEVVILGGDGGGD